jgi:hypothetical protein
VPGRIAQISQAPWRCCSQRRRAADVTSARTKQQGPSRDGPRHAPRLLHRCQDALRCRQRRAGPAHGLPWGDLRGADPRNRASVRSCFELTQVAWLLPGLPSSEEGGPTEPRSKHSLPPTRFRTDAARATPSRSPHGNPRAVRPECNRKRTALSLLPSGTCVGGHGRLGVTRTASV